MKAHQINYAIQVIPLHNPEEAYPQIDRCIEIIQASGHTHEVGPFETSVESTWSEMQELLNKLHQELLTGSINESIINLKIQLRQTGNVSMHTKTDKFL
jgi:uncharacterized protein YqgV (UPF0045/DUF77 family)